MLSADEAVLFVAMTRDNSSWRVPLMRDGGAAKVGRFSLSFGTSGPDGLTMDQNGRLFVALASLGHVFVMAPNGETIARIKSCAGATCGFRGLRPEIPIERDHAFRSKAATCSDEGGRGVVAGMRSWVRFSSRRQDWRVGQLFSACCLL
ncbi:hypothetical protein ACVWXL_008880 [Bradyrhizobium sp. GM22.5]